MAGGQEPHGVGHHQDPCGPHPPPGPVLLVGVDLPLDLLDQPLEHARVGDLHRARSPHGQGLHPLGGHHRAHPGPGRRPHQVGVDARKSHAPLSCGPHDRRLDPPVPQVGSNGLIGLVDVHAPEVGGVPERDLVIVDEDIDGLSAPTLQHDLIVPGELDLRGQVASGVGVSQDPRLGGFRRDVEPAGGGERCPDQGARRDEQLVVGPQGVGASWYLVVEPLGVEPPSPQESSGQASFQLADLHVSLGEVDPEDFPCVPAEPRHRYPTSSSDLGTLPRDAPK